LKIPIQKGYGEALGSEIFYKCTSCSYYQASFGNADVKYKEVIKHYECTTKRFGITKPQEA
jgi:hypothetical protein